MSGPVDDRWRVFCDTCSALAWSGSEPPRDRLGELTAFADTQCPRGGVSGGCPNTTQAREAEDIRRPARLLTRLTEAWDRIQEWAAKGAQIAADLDDLRNRQPRTVVEVLPALAIGRHDIAVTWPAELPAIPRVQVTAELPRIGVAAIRVAILAGSRTITGCTVVVDTTVPIPDDQVSLHVTATP